VVQAVPNMNMRTGGDQNRSEAQRQADEVRANPGTASRWEKAQLVRFALACIPLIVFVILGVIFL
jgi:hypothetical protein